MIALISAVAAITRANCLYICPVMPGMKAAGRKTLISTSVMPMIGPKSSRMASMVACLGGRPCSMWCVAPSTTTMASSTTMPMASTMAKSVSRLMEKPISAMAAKAPMMVTGTVVAGTSMARRFCRKMVITSSTSRPASISVR